VDLHAQGLDIVGTISASSEIGEVELDLVPAVVKSHRHRANKGLYSRGRLVVGSAKASAHILIVQYLHFKGKVFLQILDNHNQVGQLDSKRLLGIRRARDIRRTHVGSLDLKHQTLNVVISDSLDMAISHLFVPNLQGLRSNRVQNRQESALKRIFEHLGGACPWVRMYMFICACAPFSLPGRLTRMI